MRETRRKTRCGLDGRIRCLTTAITELKSEDSLKRCKIDMSLEPAYVRVKESHILRIEANKGILWIEPNRKDILDVLKSQMCELLKISTFLVEVLLIIGDLNDEWHSECFLHVLAENEWEHVAEMQRF